MKKKISSGTLWEKQVGYSRAIRINNTIEISGTTAIDKDGNLIGKGDPYLQSVFIIKKIQDALHQAGSQLKDVIRTRIFVTDIEHWEAIGKAHGEYFKEICPAATMIEISRLIHPDLLVEIEASAIIQE